MHRSQVFTFDEFWQIHSRNECIHVMTTQNKMANISITPENYLIPLSNQFFFIPTPNNHFLISIVLCFPSFELNINEVAHIYSLIPGLSLFGMIFRLIHVVVYIRILFYLLLSSIPLYESTFFFLNHSPLDRHLNKFQIGTIMHKATRHILIQYFCINLFSFG